MPNTPLLKGALLAVSVVTNVWDSSVRFYTEGLGYHILETGMLTERQKVIFGAHLSRYSLLGHDDGSVVRLLETTNAAALPSRLGANPWDNGMAVFEAGTPDVEQAYYKVLRARFGAIAPPTQFDCEGPEPLGYVLMKSTAFMGPAGEQIFVTQIVSRKGGVSLLKEKAVDGINTPANVVLSLATRAQQKIYANVLGISPVNDLVLKQPGAASIMCGPPDMGFDMCLMGHGTARIGMEQHVYAPHNPSYNFKTYPCDFSKTGLASAAWYANTSAEVVQNALNEANWPILGNVCLPIRGVLEPEGVVCRGPVGEILELIIP